MAKTNQNKNQGTESKRSHSATNSDLWKDKYGLTHKNSDFF